MEADMDQVVSRLDPPVGGGAVYPPALAADHFRERSAAATVG
jgi:hypothetical protein